MELGGRRRLRRRMVLVASGPQLQAPSTRIVPLSAVYGSVAAVFCGPRYNREKRRGAASCPDHFRYTLASVDSASCAGDAGRGRPEAPQSCAALIGHGARDVNVPSWSRAPVLHASSEKTYLLNLRGSGRVCAAAARQFRAHAREIEASIEAIEDSARQRGRCLGLNAVVELGEHMHDEEADAEIAPAFVGIALHEEKSSDTRNRTLALASRASLVISSGKQGVIFQCVTQQLFSFSFLELRP